MRKVTVILLFLVFVAVGLAAIAQGQQKAGAKQNRWEGTIVRIDNDAGYLDVRSSAGQEKRIHFDSSTQWTKLNKPNADRSEFKVDQRVICLGKYDEKGAFNATRIDLRLPK